LQAGFPPSSNVVQVRIRSGALIDRIEFVMIDGRVQGWGSTSGGAARTPFDLAPDEHIVQLVTQQGDSLDGLQIHTSKGRRSQWYGGRGGSQRVFAASAGNPIVSIVREPSGFCPRIAGVRLLSGFMVV
jgi:hypothetical protein